LLPVEPIAGEPKTDVDPMHVAGSGAMRRQLARVVGTAAGMVSIIMITGATPSLARRHARARASRRLAKAR
jgi:hypothetical protein